MANVKASFQIEQLTLVGIRQNVYPVATCLICRGNLTDVCVKCVGRDMSYKIDCKVAKEDENYYHQHCLTNAKLIKK